MGVSSGCNTPGVGIGVGVGVVIGVLVATGECVAAGVGSGWSTPGAMVEGNGG